MMASSSLWLYRFLLRLVLPVVVPFLWIRDRLSGKRRPPFADRMARDLPELGVGGLWIQAVSVGEVEVARRLLQELQSRQPDLPILVTATTATGLDLAYRSLPPSVNIVPCPLDLSAPVGRVLDAGQTCLVVLVETELWPELMHQAGQRGIPVAVVNGRLSEGSYAWYHRFRALLRPLLGPLSAVLVRDQRDADRFSALGVAGDRVQVMGNIKYDIEPDSAPLEWASAVQALAAHRPILVVGSTMEGEEVQVLDALARLSAGGVSPFTVLAPRHPERFDSVANLLEQRDVAFVRRSHMPESAREADVWLLDSIGELARAYQLATVTFIGGSLVPTGGHNPLEPAVWGVPVLSGRHVFNFQEVYQEMVDSGGARLVADERELTDALTHWLTDHETARDAGEAALEVVERNRGATSRTVDAVLELIGNRDSDSV
jgi:3-deoxy-D-manno-octulosonic-acid transferase